MTDDQKPVDLSRNFIFQLKLALNRINILKVLTT